MCMQQNIFDSLEKYFNDGRCKNTVKTKKSELYSLLQAELVSYINCSGKYSFSKLRIKNATAKFYDSRKTEQVLSNVHKNDILQKIYFEVVNDYVFEKSRQKTFVYV